MYWFYNWILIGTRTLKSYDPLSSKTIWEKLLTVKLFDQVQVLLWLFRCDSISQHLPLSVSGSVSQWVIHSFRFGDSYSISELCELVRCESISSTYHGQLVRRSMTDFHCLCLWTVTERPKTTGRDMFSNSYDQQLSEFDFLQHKFRLGKGGVGKNCQK